MAIIGAVVAVGSAAYGVISSSSQKNKAKEKQRQLEKEQSELEARDRLPDELVRNQELARLRSKTGLPAEQYAIAQKAINRQQSKILKGASDRKMGLNLLATVDDATNRAQSNLDYQSSQARLDNEKALMGINTQVANWKTAKANRDLSRWQNEYDYARAVEGSANQNRVNSVMAGMNALGLIAGSGNASWANGLFGSRGSRGSRAASPIVDPVSAPKRTSGMSGNNNYIIDSKGNRVYL